MDPPRFDLLDDPDRVIELLTAPRRRILDLLEEPDSATGLAARIGASRQQVNYHLRALDEAGLVELAEVRQKRGLQERLYRRTTDVIVVDPAAFSEIRLPARDAAGLTALVAHAADIIRHSATVAGEASRRNEGVAVTTLDTEIRVRSPRHLQSLLDAVADVIAQHDAGDQGMRTRVSLTTLPAL